MMDPIRYFHSVVKLGSFTAAAKEYDVTQSAISQQMKALEESLDAVLINRERKRITLTEAGEYFYNKTIPLAAYLDAVCAETHHIHKNRNKVVRIGVPNYYSSKRFRKAAAKYSKAFPDVKVDIIEGGMNALMEKMSNGILDFIICEKCSALYDKTLFLSLAARRYNALISVDNPISRLGVDAADVSDFGIMPLLVCEEDEHIAERTRMFFSRIKPKGRIIIVKSPEEAKEKLLKDNCFMPIVGRSKIDDPNIKKVMLMCDGSPVVSHIGVLMKPLEKSQYANNFLTVLQNVYYR